MSQIPFDQLSKQYLEEFLSPLGEVKRSLEIPGESKFVDIHFAPNPNRTIDDLGTLGRMIQTSCLLEPYRNAPRRAELRSCLLKLFWLQEDDRRKAKSENRSLPDTELPQLWILAATTNQPVIQEVAGQIDSSWLPGIYFLPKLFRTAIVAIDQLPETEETLWLRILGRDGTQQRAIREVLALPQNHARRNNILQILANWKVKIELGEIEGFSQQEELMAFSQAFLEWEQVTRQQGRQEGRQEGQQEGQKTLILRLLARRLGELPEEIRSQINTLSIEQLESLADALLDFSNLQDLETWLSDHH